NTYVNVTDSGRKDKHRFQFCNKKTNFFSIECIFLLFCKPVFLRRVKKELAYFLLFQKIPLHLQPDSKYQALAGVIAGGPIWDKK
ncbi:MAG: hypothetical protein LBC47_02900, partial [Tannerella sp.]|nr:hypothetical protein [Tannerella sp.]